ncbi:hypothetical protein Csa_006130, partial [Cucumis sativus]
MLIRNNDKAKSKEIKGKVNGTSGKIATEEDKTIMMVEIEEEEENLGTTQTTMLNLWKIWPHNHEMLFFICPNFQKQFTSNTPPGMPRFNKQDQFGNNPHQAYMSSTSQDKNSNRWYPDTGATNHITNDLANLNYSTNYNEVEQVHVGNGTSLKILNSGHSFFIPSDILISPNNHCPILSIPNLLHVPHIKKNLLSVSQFTKDNNCFFEFHPTICFVKCQETEKFLLQGQLHEGLYRFSLVKAHPNSESVTSHQSQLEKPHALVVSTNHFPINSSTQTLWHNRLGHPSTTVVNE